MFLGHGETAEANGGGCSCAHTTEDQRGWISTASLTASGANRPGRVWQATGSAEEELGVSAVARFTARPLPEGFYAGVQSGG
jgi:hypothetical protein